MKGFLTPSVITFAVIVSVLVWRLARSSWSELCLSTRAAILVTAIRSLIVLFIIAVILKGSFVLLIMLPPNKLITFAIFSAAIGLGTFAVRKADHFLVFTINKLVFR